MARLTEITPRLSIIIKLYCFLVITTMLFDYCSCVNSKSQDIDNYDPKNVKRAAPRFGRASPRIGRASPRIGRNMNTIFSPVNHDGQYYDLDDNTDNDFPFNMESSAFERRAAPRIGRSIKDNSKKLNA